MPLIALLPGAVAGLGLWLLLAGLLPRRASLASALQRLGTTTPTRAVAAASMESRVGSWVYHRLPDVPGFTIPVKDLALVGVTVNKYLYDKAALAAFGLVVPSLFGIFLQLLGIVPFFLPGLLGLPLAAALWFAPDQDLRGKAASARNEFSRSIAVYLELVAAERRRGAPAGHALDTAAKIGKSWVFVRIRQELTQASLDGTPPWDALTAFSEEIGVPELADVAKIIRLSGEEGASVYETLRARGKSLRVQLLNDEHTRANEASERMTLPMTMLAMVFVGIILTPLVMNLLS
jgi:pilus assembly protein TadC